MNEITPDALLKRGLNAQIYFYCNI